MKRIFIIIAVVSVLAGIASGTELPQRFNVKEEGFTLNLPYNWIRIPEEILNEHSRKVQVTAPDAEKSAYDYGFQLSGAQDWFAYPYILIWLNSSGRIPEGKIKKLTQEKKGSQPIEEKISGIPNTEVREIKYDSKEHTLWMTFLADAEKVKGLIATKLTRKGCIQIVCYAEDRDFNKYRKLFEDIVDNMYLSKEIKYTPRITDSIPIISRINFDKLFSHVFTSALLIGAIWLLLSRMKKKS